mgnify:CR=1 FL=1
MQANDDVIERARARLEAERNDLERSISSTDEESIEDGPISRTSDAAADTATAEEYRELRGQLEAQLKEIVAALARIDAGTYGIDEDTGEPINPARLDAMPTARTNI